MIWRACERAAQTSARPRPARRSAQASLNCMSDRALRKARWPKARQPTDDEVSLGFLTPDAPVFTSGKRNFGYGSGGPKGQNGHGQGPGSNDTDCVAPICPLWPAWSVKSRSMPAVRHFCRRLGMVGGRAEGWSYCGALARLTRVRIVMTPPTIPHAVHCSRQGAKRLRQLLGLCRDRSHRGCVFHRHRQPDRPVRKRARRLRR